MSERLAYRRPRLADVQRHSEPTPCASQHQCEAHATRRSASEGREESVALGWQGRGDDESGPARDEEQPGRNGEGSSVAAVASDHRSVLEDSDAWAQASAGDNGDGETSARLPLVAAITTPFSAWRLKVVRSRCILGGRRLPGHYLPVSRAPERRRRPLCATSRGHCGRAASSTSSAGAGAQVARTGSSARGAEGHVDAQQRGPGTDPLAQLRRPSHRLPGAAARAAEQ